jgi:hypothetical protein
VLPATVKLERDILRFRLAPIGVRRKIAALQKVLKDGPYLGMKLNLEL